MPALESQLCHFEGWELEQVTKPLCASVSSSVNVDNNSTRPTEHKGASQQILGALNMPDTR